jgi:hypothetical protein
MARYKIWDKQETIYTIAPDKTGKGAFTPEEWIAKWPWAGIPGVKTIIGGGAVNGTVCMQFDMMVEAYKKRGAAIIDGMSDEEILAAIEEFEDTPPPPGEPTPEERQAAALEMMALNGMEDVE